MNDAVTLYFPELHAIATPQPLFAVGTGRVDVEMGQVLGAQVRLAMVGLDGE